MTRAARIVYSVALVMGLSLGLTIGLWNATTRLRIAADAEVDTAPAWLDDFSYVQYKYATPEHATAALTTTIRLLEELEQSHPAKPQEIDLAVAYTRLAMLADASDSAQSKTLMAKARYWHVTSGGRDYSDEEMKARLLASDRVRPSLLR
jgi:hypothetical protein